MFYLVDINERGLNLDKQCIAYDALWDTVNVASVVGTHTCNSE